MGESLESGWGPPLTHGVDRGGCGPRALCFLMCGPMHEFLGQAFQGKRIDVVLYVLENGIDVVMFCHMVVREV